MSLSTLLQFIVTTFFLALAAALPNIDSAAYDASNIITRDICIIGGGSSGTYSAIRLHDEGKSVVIVEAKDRLGGHTQTYTDPSTSATIDYGVVVWHNISLVKSYFARFNISLTDVPISLPPSEYVDFRTGKVVTGYTPSDPTAALVKYGAQLAKYPYLDAGFGLPDPVPADLLLPFGDFVKKYAIGDAVDIYYNYAQGFGDLLSQSTLYVLKVCGLTIIQGFKTGFLTSANQDNSEIYEKARVELGQDVLLESRVLAMDRSGSGVKILVQTLGGVKLILADKVVIAIPPKLNNLAGFDLDASEQDLFGQFQNSAYYTGLFRTTGITTTLTSIGPNTSYNLPVLPGVYYIGPTSVPGLYDVKFGSPVQLSDAQVKADIAATVRRLRTAGTAQTTAPDWVVFSSHTPFALTVPKEAIEAGFYKKLNALQGQRYSYYTGAAFQTQDSSLVWQFTEALLPSILA